MALIKCPECGQNVSDKATNCIHCGAPLKVEKGVKIKIPRFVTGMMSQKAATADVKVNGKQVWNGVSGAVASFDVDAASDIIITVFRAYTGHPLPFFRDFSINGKVEPGKRYEIKNARVSLALGDPTRSEWVISEVDVIDSGV